MGKSMLVIVLGFSTVFSVTLFNISSSQQRSAERLVEQYQKIITRNGVESVTNVAISKALRSDTTSATMTLDDVTCKISRKDATEDSVIEASKKALTIACDYNGIKDSTTIVLMRPAYSYFYYFNDSSWPSHLLHETGDTLTAPIYANDRIDIDGYPVYLDKVVSTADGFNVLNSGKARTFGGTEFEADAIPLPDGAALASLEDAITDQGMKFLDNHDLHITFKADSTFDWAQDGNTGNVHLADINGLIWLARSRDLHVKGQVAGKVTVLADDDIVIDSTLVYANSPFSIDGSDDYLGLIAKDNIKIASDYSNLEIHAAMIALNHFEVRNHDSVLPRGTLTIVGSLAVHDDEPSGVLLGELLVNGYLRNHVYDSRLRDKTPPYFPRLPNRIEIAYRSD